MVSEHTAKIFWAHQGARFSDNKYSRAHTWTFDGGTIVPASSSPHVVPIPASDPAGVDPEEAFIASLASCHMLWFLSIACKRGFVVDRYLDQPVGEMAFNSHRKLALTRITLKPRVTFVGTPPTRDEFEAMHHDAHDECFIANSVLTEIFCEPLIDEFPSV